jgi:pentatricopeptide repeat protein
MAPVDPKCMEHSYRVVIIIINIEMHVVMTRQLHSLKRGSRVEDCVACFDEMVANGVRPTTKAYDGK